MNERPTPQKPPFQLAGLMTQAMGHYRAHFGGLILLSLLSYLPFWALGQLSSAMDLGDLAELFHGFLLDILVFLALPTLLVFRKIYPIETLKIFTDYFAAAIVVVLLQVFALFFLMFFFSGFGVMFALFGLAPFIFLIFVGQFSLVNNAPRLLDLKDSLVDSFNLVKQHFWSVFLSYLNLSTLMILPILLFSIYFMQQHPEVAQLAETEEPLDAGRLFTAIQKVMEETSYQMGRMGIHLVFRPFKALVMALILAKLLEKTMPEKYNAYFKFSEPPAEEAQNVGQGVNPKE